ncbi:MAG: gliding motility-associated C-terminal domain-containing protein [Saprospiraceae bacterium]|nr:gliding motility-associated C-terminal domain-containing protein [Saprospiraceae bacterium]
MYIPNAFSPDGDGINDFFSVFSDSKATRLKSLAIYDRWGNLLFQSYDLPLNQPERGWNGTTSSGVRVPTGTYIYKVEVELLNEKTELMTGVVQVF